jgi:hypothetical protein
MHDDRPNTSINQYKWSALEPKFKIIVALACAGLSRSKIYRDSRVQEHYSSAESVGPALEVARRRLGISKIAWARYRQQGITAGAIGDD